jgi:hypothetical protein
MFSGSFNFAFNFNVKGFRHADCVRFLARHFCQSRQKYPKALSTPVRTGGLACQDRLGRKKSMRALGERQRLRQRRTNSASVDQRLVPPLAMDPNSVQARLVR